MEITAESQQARILCA